MQLYDAQKQLYDVPNTFRRPTLIYQQLIAALASALTLLTQASSGISDQTAYSKAIAGWIDVWGDLAGILRNSGEADSVFSTRIPSMLLAARDSIVAIQTWLSTIENLPTSLVIENLALGYSVTLPGNLTPARVATVAKNLAWVRPAGMPFNFSSRSGGTYLNTVNYLGATIWNAPILVGSPGSNYIRDSSMANAASGVPGVLPDFWSESHNTGITPSVVGSGTVVLDAFTTIPYIDLLFSASGAVAGNNNIFFDVFNSATAVLGDQRTESMYLQVVGGSLANISNVTLILSQRSSGGTQLGNLLTIVSPTSASLQRFSNAQTIANASTAYTLPSLQVNPTSGAVSLTLRVGLPQINPGLIADVPTVTTSIGVSGGLSYLMTNAGIPILATGRFPWQGGRVTGSYLAFKYTAAGALPPASTNNNVSQLPDLMLLDPTLNPNQAAPLLTL